MRRGLKWSPPCKLHIGLQYASHGRQQCKLHESLRCRLQGMLRSRLQGRLHGRLQGNLCSGLQDRLHNRLQDWRQGWLQKGLKSKKGNALADMLIFLFITVFIVLPLFAAVTEGYLLLNRTQILRDAVDMANVSSYIAINGSGLGRKEVRIDGDTLRETWSGFLASNLKLAPDLTPGEGSVVDGKVEILELDAYISGLPLTCGNGERLSRPSVHSVVTFPVKPSLFGKMILALGGGEFVYIKIHTDSEIPVND